MSDDKKSDALTLDEIQTIPYDDSHKQRVAELDSAVNGPFLNLTEKDLADSRRKGDQLEYYRNIAREESQVRLREAKGEREMVANRRENGEKLEKEAEDNAARVAKENDDTKKDNDKPVVPRKKS